MQGTVCGKPAPIAACRAGFMPTPAQRTWPRITSSTASAGIPVRDKRLAMTLAPKVAAGIVDRLPPNEPMAVRPAATMTTSDMFGLLCSGASRPLG
jgi:hypothetical protein